VNAYRFDESPIDDYAQFQKWANHNQEKQL